LTLDPDGATESVTHVLTFATAESGTYVVDGEAPRIFTLLPLETAWRVANISNRGASTPGSPCIAGLIIDGRDPRLVLVRVAGPALATMGVTSAAIDPALRVYAGQAVLVENEDWSPSGGQFMGVSAAVTATGAFPFLADSKDAAVVLSLEPGAYTIHALVDEPGEVLIEAYLIP
jgi:hypothetical protein